MNIMKVNTTIVEDIRTNQLRWYGHVVRMEKERLPKQVLLWTPQGRRRKGRPRRSWTKGIRDYRLQCVRMWYILVEEAWSAVNDDGI
jgi:hypothetical protein